MKFLSYESKFSQIILKLCNCCYLNLLWLICSIPIFTIGASTSALYSVTLKIARNEDVIIHRQFFKAFRENFRQATVLWLILLVLGLCLGGDIYILYHLHTHATGTIAVILTLMLALVIVATIAYVMILFYVFPLVTSVVNTNIAMLKNSFLISIRYLFCTILVFGIHFAVFFVSVRIFTPLLIFVQGFCAMLSSPFLSNVIQACSYNPNETNQINEK